MEVMVVLAIMAAIVGLIIPQIDNKNNQIKAEMRKLTTLTRQVRNLARMQNSTYRLVLDLQEGPSSETSHTYWLERASGEILAVEDREESYIKAIDQPIEEADMAKSPEDFAIEKTLLKEPKSLPSNMIFESVEFSNFDKPVTRGKIFIHFFPSGLVEEAAIHLKLGENQWTLAIHPLTGKANIASRFLSLKEIKDQ